MTVKSTLDLMSGGKLTRGLYDFMVSCGCEPHCHLCGAKLDVGALFGFVRVGNATPAQRVSACKPCFDEPSASGLARAASDIMRRERRVAERKRDDEPRSRGFIFDDSGRIY